MKNINKYKTLVRSAFLTICQSFLFCGIFILSNPQESFGYDNDTHFWLTYYLATKAGYTKVQATQIASANVSVDFDKDTEPVMPRLKLIDYFHPLSKQQWVRHYFHALPRRSTIWCLARKEESFNKFSPQEPYYWNPTKETIEELQKIAETLVNNQKDILWEAGVELRNPGIFLHFQQDSHAHQGFNSWLGHAGYYYIDFLDSKREKAVKMAIESFEYLKRFRAEALKNPSPPTTSAEKEEISRIVSLFSAVNKSPGIKENVLVENWNAFSDDQRYNYRFPPKTYWLAFSLMPDISPVPDSRKSRDLVQQIFNYKDAEMPNIWKYDLDETGEPGQNTAKSAFIYIDKPKPQVNKTFTAKDERSNYKLSRVPEKETPKQCLPFALVDESHNDVPLCKNAKQFVKNSHLKNKNRVPKYIKCSIENDAAKKETSK